MKKTYISPLCHAYHIEVKSLVATSVTGQTDLGSNVPQITSGGAAAPGDNDMAAKSQNLWDAGW